MADNNQQLDKPLLPAQKEFNVILDVLKVPLRTDGSDQKLPPHRGWGGGCLLELKYPDLVPVPVNPNADVADPEAFCKRDDQVLTVTVRNQGDAKAPPSVTRVIFSPGGSFDLDTPELDPGASVGDPGDSVELSFPIPPDCFDPDCEFEISVDATDKVVEKDEGNNTVSGKCLGSQVG
jgi:CARDB